MTAVHSAMLESIEDYNKVSKDLEYRYPEKGDDTKRKYLPMRSRSLEQIEKEMGLDAVLSGAKERVDQKYAPIVEEAKKKEKVHGEELLLRLNRPMRSKSEKRKGNSKGKGFAWSGNTGSAAFRLETR